MKAKLLLVWEQVGEQAFLYVLDTDSTEAQWARESAGFYINADDLPDDHAIFKLNAALGGKHGRPKEEARHLTGPFAEAVICGFFL